MPTTVITGRDVTFTLDSANYDAQATSAVLSCETIIETYQTLDGRAYKSVDKQWTFTIELLQDWGAASPLRPLSYNQDRLRDQGCSVPIRRLWCSPKLGVCCCQAERQVFPRHLVKHTSVLGSSCCPLQFRALRHTTS